MTSTEVITDRRAIADIVNAGLNELDDLRASYQGAQQQVTAAQQAADAAADIYAAKINEVLATGWATPQALSAQGHEVPKKRTPAARGKRANTDAPEQ